MSSTHHAVVFGYPEGQFVALASDIECFEVDLFVRGAGDPTDLDQHVGISAAESDVPPKRLLTSHFKVLTTTADIRFDTVDSDRFFLLPWLLRQADCDKWVRGLVELDNPSCGDKALAVWIDLHELASST